MLPERIEYTGEYGSELGIFVPFVHFLKKNNMLQGVKVISYSGMRPYYFFLDDNEYEEKNQPRFWVHPDGRWFIPQQLRNDDEVFSNGGSVQGFLPPDYVSQFGGKMRSTQPLLLVQNKFNSEWGGPPINFMDIDELRYIFTELQDVYQIVYMRTNQFRGPGYSHDHNELDSFKIEDKEMIKSEFPKVALIEELLTQNPNVDFNVFKCMLQADARATISTIGGFNFFDAYFPSKHLIYKKDAPERYVKSFYQNQHDMCCPGRSSEIMFASNNEELKTYVQELKKLAPTATPINMEDILKVIEEKKKEQQS